MSYKKLRKTMAFLLYSAILVQSFTVFAGNGNWGLSFPNPGEKPVGNERADYLKNYDAYFMGADEEKVIYLTFDAGYENGCTEPILDVLKKSNVPAAFFLVGTYIKQYPELVKRMVDEGHIVGNHTMKHPDMTTITDRAAFEKELSQTADLYQSVTGLEMKKYYRPPQGRYTEPNLKMAQELGYKTIFWSLAYKDYDNDQQPSQEEAFSKLIPRVHPGAIVLLHSTSKANTQILEELIKRYTEMGYTFKSLDELNVQ